MKPVKSKAQIRAEIDAQIQQYLSEGGQVSQCAQGESGRDGNAPMPKSPFVERSDTSRTPVLSEIKAIEARRKPAAPKKTKRPSKDPEKVLLTDDFGEPIRWVSE